MKYIFLSLFVIITVLSSCIVSSTMTDVPLVEKKGQIVSSVGVQFPIPGAQASLAYGITKSIAVYNSADFQIFNSYYAQHALGYYKVINELNQLEIYSGIAYGKGSTFNSYGSEYPPAYFGNYYMGFLQCNYAKKSKKNQNWIYGLSLKPAFFRLIYSYHHYEPIPPFESEADQIYVKDDGLIENAFYVATQFFIKKQINQKTTISFNISNQVIFGEAFNSLSPICYSVVYQVRVGGQKQK